MPEPSFPELIEAMKAAAGILNDSEIEFVLGGGLSAWARGGPRSEHDVDFLIKPEDAERALEVFDAAGWKIERPPEGWLYKTWHENGALVDLIFDPASGPITQEIINRAHEDEVMALRAKVATLEDVLVSKLLAMVLGCAGLVFAILLRRADRARGGVLEARTAHESVPEQAAG